MKLTVLTVCPKYFDSLMENQVFARAVNNGAVEINVVDIREYTKGSFRAIDDSPYGGGNGMILRVDALCNALNAVRSSSSHVVLLSPKGKTFNQTCARKYCDFSDLIIVCGHFEGYDARFEKYADEIVSLGDFILSGGESAAIVIMDSIVRLLPGVMKDNVTADESFESGMLEYNQYTHPYDYKGDTVPSVLLSGNQKEIKDYKNKSSLEETLKFRPDLLHTN